MADGSPVAGASQSGAADGRLSAWIPVLEWLPRYQREGLGADLVAALTVWALVVPQAIAYSQIAGLPPQSGLFAAAAGMMAYGLLGTCRQLVVSPTSSTAAISASLVGAIALSDPARFASLSATLALSCGLIFLLLGAARLGFVSRFIPTSVQVGFMFGLGMTIIVGQSAKILGVPGVEGTFFAQVGQILHEVGGINGWSVALGVAALAALLLGPRFVPILPWALIVVVGGVVLVAVLGLGSRGVEVIGVVEGAVPLPAIPQIQAGDLMALVPGALAISIVGSAESLTVSQRFADEHRYEIRPNQELIATGGANILAGLFQGFIVGGGASQSAAADRAGARSLLASFVCSALVVLTSVALLPLFRDLPQAVLGAIVISAVIGFLRVDELRRLSRLRRDSFLISLFALGATLLLGILPGLITAVVLTIILLLVRFTRPSTTVLGRDPSGTGYVSIARQPSAAVDPGLLLIRLDAPLLYLNAARLRDQLRREIQSAPTPVKVAVLDLGRSGGMDIESMDILVGLSQQLGEQGTELWLAEVEPPIRNMLARAGINGHGPPLRLFPTLDDANAEWVRRPPQ